ncbi:MAG: hypothetical protein IJP00_00375 [Firmicutes bacterium]|nr:hypothetical protein [Bacillota bacterium]
MRKFNYFCSFIIVLTVSLFIITFGQNIAARTSGTYLFHFNENRVVNHVITNFTNTEMSNAIADCMNSWRPDEFQIYEDTGYDMEGIFDEIDSQNMLNIKFALDISLIVCILSFIISVAIIVYFLKNNFKLVLRKRLKVISILTTVLIAGEGFIFFVGKGNDILKMLLDFQPLAEDSNLKILLGGEFIPMFGIFTLLYCLVAFLAVAYFIHFVTRPPRIFY